MDLRVTSGGADSGSGWPWKRGRVGVEDDAAVEDRQHAHAGRVGAIAAQAKLAAVVWRPGPVQVDEHVDAPQESTPTIHIEVRVHVELAAGENLMEGTTPEMRVGNQASDAGEPFEEVKEGHLVELGQDTPNLRIDPAKIALLRAPELADLVGGDVWLLKMRVIGLGKRVRQNSAMSSGRKSSMTMWGKGRALR